MKLYTWKYTNILNILPDKIIAFKLRMVWACMRLYVLHEQSMISCKNMEVPRSQVKYRSFKINVHGSFLDFFAFLKRHANLELISTSSHNSLDKWNYCLKQIYTTSIQIHTCAFLPNVQLEARCVRTQSKSYTYSYDSLPNIRRLFSSNSNML